MKWRRLLIPALMVLATLQSHAADLLGPGAGTISLADQQLNNSNWAAANLLDDNNSSLWLSSRRDNDLIFELDASGIERCFDSFTLQNHGGNRSIREFVLLHTLDASLGSDTGTAGWTPVIADATPSGPINHVHWGQGGRLTAIDSQLDSSTWAAAHMNNGNLGDFWLSNSNNNTLDFAFDSDWDGNTGDAVEINEIALHNYGTNRSIRQFQIEVSQDGNTWHKLEVPGSNAGEPDFNFALRQEGAMLDVINRQLDASTWAGANIHDGSSQSRWLSNRANNNLDFSFDTNGDGTTGLDGDVADHFTLEKITLENYGSARSVRDFQVLVKTAANPTWTAIPVPGSAAGTADYNFAVSHQGGELTAIDRQLDSSGWAAANIHDGTSQSIWLSDQANNHLDFAFDADGDGSTGGAGDLFTLQKISIENYGSARSVKDFQVEVQTSADPSWRKLEDPGTAAGDAEFNFLLQHEGGALTSINSQLNTSNWAAANMQDGSPRSVWLSDNQANTFEFAFDTNLDGSTGDGVNLSSLRMQNYGSQRSVATFEIDVQVGGGPWQAVLAPGGGTVFNAVQASTPQSWPVTPQNNVTAFRIRTLTNFGDTYTGIRELELLGTALAPDHTFTAAQSAAEQVFTLPVAKQPAQVTAVRLLAINNYGDTYVGMREFKVLGESITRETTFTAERAATEQVFAIDPVDQPTGVTALRLQTISNHGDSSYTGVREVRWLGPALAASHTFEANSSSARQVFTLDAEDVATDVVAARLRTLSNHGDGSYSGAREIELLGSAAGPSYLFNPSQDNTAQSWSFSTTAARFFRLHTTDNFGDSYTGAAEVSLESVANCSPLASWLMDESSWGTVTDSSGNNYQGSPANGANTGYDFPVEPAAPGTCRHGVFDGVDDYVSLPTFPNLDGSFTIATWIRPNELGNDQRIFADDSNNDGGFAFSLGDGSTGRLRFSSRLVNPVSLDTGAVITQDTWHFVAAVHDAANKTRSIYVDGAPTPVAQGTYTGNWGTDAGPVSIGGEIDGTSESVAQWRFNGALDEMRIYQRTLSGQELAFVKNQTRFCGSTGSSDEPAAVFNCIEPGADAIAGRLLTKRVGSAFVVDIAALRDANNDTVADSVETQYAQNADRTVTLELVDSTSGAACSALPSLSPAVTQAVTFQATDSGRKQSANLTVNRAYPSIACRVSDTNDVPAVVGCSTDRFAVRPTSLTLQMPTLNNGAATGMPATIVDSAFELSVSGGVGYNGSPLITANPLEAHAGAVALATLSGNFGAANAANGVATGSSFKYKEVGSFRLLADAVRDAGFSAVDQPDDCIQGSLANSPDGSGKIGCDFSNPVATDWIGRFTPDHFTVAVTEPGLLNNTCTGFSYAGTGIGYLTNPELLITARAGDGTVTQNYTGLYNKLSPAEVTYSSLSEDATAIGDDGLSPVTLSLTSGIPTLLDNGDGTLQLTLRDDVYTYGRSSNNLIGEFISDVTRDVMTVTDTEDNTSATGLPITLAPLGVPVRYGRVSIDSAFGSELQNLPVAMRIEYFSGINNRFENNLADACTTISNLTITDADISDSLLPADTCIWDALGDSGPFACATAGDAGDQYTATPVAGNFNLNLAPTGGGIGVLQISADIEDWLKFDWLGSGNANPTATATFGRYRGHDRIVYIREVR